MTVPTADRRPATRALLLLGLVGLLPQIHAADEATLGVDIHAPGSQSWQHPDRATVRVLDARLAETFGRAGFDAVASRWCGAPQCPPAPDQPHLRLDVHLGEVRSGELQRGISFGFGSGNPRASGVIEGTIMNIACRLRTPGGRLIAAGDSDEPVLPELAAGATVDGAYLGDKIADACAPLFREQDVVVLAPTVQPVYFTTADPDVYMEKRELPASLPVAASAERNPTADGAAPRSRPDEETERGLRGQRVSRDKRVQYVLHTQQDTVYLEFGHRR